MENFSFLRKPAVTWGGQCAPDDILLVPEIREDVIVSRVTSIKNMETRMLETATKFKLKNIYNEFIFFF